MLPVGNRPFMEHVILALAANGVKDLYVVVGYQKERVMDHFEELFTLGAERAEVVGAPQPVAPLRHRDVLSCREVERDHEIFRDRHASERPRDLKTALETALDSLRGAGRPRVAVLRRLETQFGKAFAEVGAEGWRCSPHRPPRRG